MYNLPFFKAENEASVWQFMQANPFVNICGIAEDGYPVVAQTPILLKKEGDKMIISGHIMLKQKHSLAFEKNNKVLVVFSAPSTFVSASWYTEPHGASTWNYQSVHATGDLAFKDNAHLIELLTNLTKQFEKDANAPSQVHNLSAAYMEQQLKAIVSFDIVIKDLQHVFKLSQNRDQASYQNIKNELIKGDAAAQYIANEMQRGIE